MCVSSGDTSIHADSLVCGEHESCQTCAGRPACGWSSEEQKCVDTTRPTGNGTAVVGNALRCPRFSVVRAVLVMSGDHYKYTHRVQISNDLDGFASFLGQRKIGCCYDYTCGPTAATVAGGYIVCDETTYRPATDRLVYFSIVFDEIKLKFDDENDNYFTDNGRVPDTDAAGCLHCVLFYGDSLSHRKKWCPGDRHWPADPQNRPSGSNAGHALFSISRVWCKDVVIRSAEPLYAPWSGGTTVTIAVTNHWTVAEFCDEIVVTTAGRPCADVATPDNVTITCTVSSTDEAAAGAAEGPINVVYVFPWARYTVTSTETFHLVEPAVTGFSPVCGSIEDDARLTVTGVHLDAGNAFGVHVASVGGRTSVPCETLWRSRDVAQCTAGPGTRDARVRGLVEVQFDGAARKYAVARPAVRAGQTLVGIAAGGTAVPVRGVHFSCTADRTSMFVVHDAVRYFGRGCRATNDTHMVCQSPALDPSAAGSYLELGFRTRFADRTSDLYPVPECDYYAAPDPAYIDFETDNGTALVINGPAEPDDLRLVGYGVADVTVTFSQNRQWTDAEQRCSVTSASRHRIVCVSDWPLYAVQAVRVAVGSVFSCRVLRKSVQYSSESSTVFRTVVAGSAFLLCAGIVFMCAFCLKTNKRYTANADRIAGFRPPPPLSDPNAAAPGSDAVRVQDSTENDDL